MRILIISLLFRELMNEPNIPSPMTFQVRVELLVNIYGSTNRDS
jgi:hypothetical protein